MRSFLLNRTTNNVLGDRQDRIVAAGKEKLCAMLRAGSFFSRQARRAGQRYLTPVSLTALLRSMRSISTAIARAARQTQAASLLPAQASYGPHRCWHSMHGVPHASAGTR
jgi:hypothetical protein